MNVSMEDALGQELVNAIKIQDGQMQISDEVVKQVGARIHQTEEREPFAAALIALATRLKDLPGSRPATGQVIALAAIALGDVALNGALCKALYARRPG
jgi:hypothetical protein